MEKMKKNKNKGIFARIYALVAEIPAGSVATYKQIAMLSGIQNPRVVGFAMRANKNTKEVPCHRVVSSNGELRGYAFGGLERKRKLLQQEGITFLENGTVDLAKSLYTPVN